MAKKYEILEHPAELRLRVYGKTIEELFMNAVEAMANTLATSNKRQAKKTEKEILKIQSADINSLLVDFLSEILAKSQINKCIYLVPKIRVSIVNSQKSKVVADLVGYPVDHFDEDIKAITYQDLNIQKIDGIWQTILVFDI
jgi:SHS2 domain-containing protein